MFCDYCGQRIPNNSEACPQCGSVLGQAMQYEDEDYQLDYIEDMGIGRQAQTAAQTAAKAAAQTASRAVHRAARQVNDGAASFARTVNQRRTTGTTAVEGWEDADFYNDEDGGATTGGQADNAQKRSGGFVLAEGEVVIRRYTCADIGGFLTPMGKGYITVTNKRVTYEGKSGDNRLAMEAPIDSIGGIYAYYGKKVRVLMMIVAVLMILFGLFIALATFKVFQKPGWVMFIIGAILAVLSFRPAYQIIIYCNKTTGAAVNVGEGPVAQLGNNSLYTLPAKPDRDSDRLIAEIGALIQDVQQLGDRAIEKWRGR